MRIFKTALVLTLIGLLCGAVIGLTNYITAPIIKKNAEKRAQEAYKSFFSDLDDITEHELEGSSVYVYIEIKEGSNLLGYVFKAKGNNQRGVIDLAAAYDTSGKLVGIKILESEHTAGFYDQYIDSANNTLVGLDKETLVLDNIAGVTQSGDLLKTLLKDIHTEVGKHIEVVSEVDLYKELFEDKETVEEDTSFTATEKVTKKETVKDVNGNVLGYVYTLHGTSTTPLHDYDESGSNYITLLVGVDGDNKIVGVKVLKTDHTSTYLNEHNVYFDSLVGVLVSEAPVDDVADATVSRGIIRELIDALKAVLQ
jgi:electron transport complex protein RnfG